MDLDLADPMGLLACARALDARLHDTLPERFRLPRGRLYGCTVHAGDEEPLHIGFLGEHRDVYELLAGPVGEIAREYDAALIAVTGWGSPVDGALGQVRRPSKHPLRYRIRVSAAVGDGGVVSVLRAEHEPEVVHESFEQAVGVMPDALRAMWEGDPLVPARHWEPPRASTRHRRG